MSELKPGWRCVQLGDVVDNVNEYFDRNSLIPERYVAGEHIDENSLSVRRWGATTDDLFPPTFNRRFRAGDVLFHSRNLRKLASPNFDGVTGEKLFVLRVNRPDQLLPSLLPFLLQTQRFEQYAEQMSAGSTNKFLNKTPLMRYELALPPIEEQHRWAQVLVAFQNVGTHLGTAIDSGENTRERLALDLLLPKQTQFWRDSTLRNAPTGWKALTIRDLCDQGSDLTIGPFGSNLLSSDYVGRSNGVPVLFVRDIRPNQFEYLSNCYVSPDKAKELRTHTAVPGDLLVTKVGVPEFMGTPPGLAAVLPPTFPQSVITADVVRARLNERKALPEYVARLLNTSWGRQQTWRISPGSTTRFKMTLGNFARILLPIPPLEYQRDAVNNLVDLSSGIETLRIRLVNAKAAQRSFLETVHA